MLWVLQTHKISLDDELQVQEMLSEFPSRFLLPASLAVN